MLGGTQRDHGTVDMSYDNNSVCIPETGTGSMGPSVQRPVAIPRGLSTVMSPVIATAAETSQEHETSHLRPAKKDSWSVKAEARRRTATAVFRTTPLDQGRGLTGWRGLVLAVLEAVAMRQLEEMRQVRQP